MGDHRTNPIKYCYTCDKHFKADKDVHGETYHSEEIWQYIDGTWRDAVRKERFKYL